MHKTRRERCPYCGFLDVTAGHFRIVRVPQRQQVLNRMIKQNSLARMTVYVRPDKDMINRYVSLSETAVFVKPLISESPVISLDNGMKVPTLEKLLVDINADNDFFYLQGEEAFYIFRNALERYCINEARLLRYARRRNLEQIIKGYMEEVGI